MAGTGSNPNAAPLLKVCSTCSGCSIKIIIARARTRGRHANKRAHMETARNSRNSRNSKLSCWNMVLFLFRHGPEQPEQPEQAKRNRLSRDLPPAPRGKSSPRLGIKLCELFLTLRLPPRLLSTKGSGCGWVGWIRPHPAPLAAAVLFDARVRGSGSSAHRAPAARCARQLTEGQRVCGLVGRTGRGPPADRWRAPPLSSYEGRTAG
ncbi:Uncharacterised protein [Brevundimonas vancanneytii]|uniref:Uncharacterized protein n=1 Tax=Brevundimonas vancanneytii TaxID=1325724 RepID=A0A4P1K0A2_9CAUL|nr:Uncharacterised protein [Brevundimonas vancanneytii]